MGGGRDSGWIIKIASVNTVGTFLRGDFILMQITLAILSLGGAGPGMRALGLEPDPHTQFRAGLDFRGLRGPCVSARPLPVPGAPVLTSRSFRQVLDGYFVHYFAPRDLPPLPKNVVFVLDSSASMVGAKLRQVSPSLRCRPGRQRPPRGPRACFASGRSRPWRPSPRWSA